MDQRPFYAPAAGLTLERAVWWPNSVHVTSCALCNKFDPEIEAAIRAASPDYTREIVETGGGNTARYLYSHFDLNDDGHDEVFAYLLGSTFCGTGGCNLLIFERSGQTYSLVSDFSITRTPVIVTAKVSNGWRDIWRYRSGGGAAANYIADRFDGSRYVDGEVITGEDSPAGVRVLAGEFAFADGIVLEPPLSR